MSWSICGRQLEQRVAVLLGADAARVDGATTYGRRWPASPRAMTARVRDGLGAVHVGVDDVGPDLGQVGGQRADRDRVVGVVDDEDRRRRPAGACGRRCPPTATRPRRRSASGPSGSRARRGAPGRRRSCRSRGPRRPGSPAAGSGGRSTGVEAGIARASGRSRQPFLPPDEEALDRLVHGAPLVLVGLVAAQEVEPPHAGRERALDVGVDHHDARRQVARVGVDAGVVVEVAVGRLEVDPGRDPPAADRQERQAERAVRPVELEQAAEEDPALAPARRVREEAVGAPALLVEVDERVEVGERVGRVVEADLADGLGAADLAPDLVALLLAERREEAVDVGAGRAASRPGRRPRARR